MCSNLFAFSRKRPTVFSDSASASEDEIVPSRYCHPSPPKITSPTIPYARSTIQVKTFASAARSAPIANTNNNVGINETIKSPGIQQSSLQTIVPPDTNEDETKQKNGALKEISESLGYIKAMMEAVLKQLKKNTQEIKELKEQFGQQQKQVTLYEDSVDITDGVIPIQNAEQFNVLELRIESDKMFKKAMVSYALCINIW